MFQRGIVFVRHLPSNFMIIPREIRKCFTVAINRLVKNDDRYDKRYNVLSCIQNPGLEKFGIRMRAIFDLLPIKLETHCKTRPENYPKLIVHI